ncbi:MAG: flagellar basal body L-ring protein FlgH [Opitutales bacterium]
MKLRQLIPLIFLTIPLLGGLSAESIWLKSSRPAGMFGDDRARAVGDIVTIVVEESASVTASKSSSTNKSSEVADAISKVLRTSAGVSTGFPSSEWNNSSDFAGGGSVSDTQSAQSQLSVMVVDRLPNGTLAIEGMRRITMANEINYAVIRGFIRPSDVRVDNTILSSRIADAQVDFIAEGSLTEAQRKGWLNRLQSYVNPF